MAGQHDDGGLKTVFAQDAHRLAAVDIRQPHIHDDQVDLSGFGGLHAFAAILGRHGLEFFVQRQLFRQRIAQFRIVIDNENLARIRHLFEARPSPWRATGRAMRRSTILEHDRQERKPFPKR